MTDKIVELSRGVETAEHYGECKRLAEVDGVNCSECSAPGKR